MDDYAPIVSPSNEAHLSHPPTPANQARYHQNQNLKLTPPDPRRSNSPLPHPRRTPTARHRPGPNTTAPSAPARTSRTEICL
jgi:hypothetical protein